MLMKKKNDKVAENKSINGNNSFKTFQKKCGVISCMHCLNGKCQNDFCDFYERRFIQEG